MSIHDDRQMAGRAAFLRWLEYEVKDAKDKVRKAVEPRMEPGERIRAELADGTVIGSVTIGKAPESARVTDEKALLAWVKENKPTEILEQVNPAYVAVLLAQAKVHGHAFDRDTGAVIPGIEVVQGTPAYRPVVAKESIPVLRQRLAEIVASGVLEIPGAAGGDAA